VIGYRYPGQFKDHIVEVADGERIAASIALQEAARPSLIVVHGLFTSSRFDYVRAIAVRAFYEWGFNVAALDLRSFGMTELTSPAPSTAGWKEGLDILALARYMKELGGTSVGALGISLGGSSVLNACDQEGTATALDGGILAVSPPAITKLAWERLSEPVPRGHPRYPIHRAFEAALISRIRSGRWPPEAEDMLRAMEVVSAPYYQVGAEEIWTHARGIDHVPGSKVPLLILHPEDDHIIKVDHARMLQQAANGNDLVRVWILRAGSHGLLEAADPRWTHAVYRTFFERWASYAERTGPQGNGRSADLVYSSQEPG
jgi:predicted alpha/beta-fold hydrolase